LGLSKKISKKSKNEKTKKIINKTIKKVSEDIELMSFHTAVSSLMICINEFQLEKNIPQKDWEKFLIILAPFAPYLTEELWKKLGHKKSIHLEKWPSFDKKLIQEELKEVVVQINGKKRGVIKIKQGESKTNVEEKALKLNNVFSILKDKQIKKVIYVPEKVINFVI